MNVLGMTGLLLAQTGTTADSAAGGALGWIVLAVIVAIFVVPILLGNLIARMLKLKDISGRISVVLFALTLGVAPFVWHFVQGKVEASQYAAELDDWNTKAKRTSNRIKPDDENVKALEEAIPGLEIRYDESVQPGTSEISSKGPPALE